MSHKVLCVDCDGTLVATDLLIEGMVRAVLHNPLRIFSIIFWILRGPQCLKSRISEISSLDPSKLPYREEVISFLKTRRDAGWRVFLATAANERYASQISTHLKIFDGVFASDDKINLKGAAKQARLLKEFGAGGYDYAGDAECDFIVWSTADVAIPVAQSAGFARKISQVNPRVEPLCQGKPGVSRWLELIRFHQWAKNLIIFAPLVTSHQIFNSGHLWNAMAAFLSLSLVASATYIINDIVDLDNDRSHKTKSRRPIANGDLGIGSASLLAGFLLLLGSVTAFLLPPVFGLCLAIYVVATMLYSLVLKRIPIADAIVLAGLYTLRLLAGHAATGIPLSAWLLAFSIFIFFSLALAKRYVELAEFEGANVASKDIPGRGYRPDDLWLIGTLGVSCGVLSVLVLILYVNSQEVLILYTSPVLLMLLAPIFLYWIGRVWLLASRGLLNEDPVLFALRDKISYVVGLATSAVIVVASSIR